MSNGKNDDIRSASMKKFFFGIEGTFGLSLTVYNIPALLKFRLLGTATPIIYHQSILSDGLIPKSMLKIASQGLTPPITDIAQDAPRRIFLGGYNSANVYSNIIRLNESVPDWKMKVKNYRFNFSFLFKPTFSIFKYPLWAAVPESIFQRSFVPDDKSIVKILSNNFYSIPRNIKIPYAFKSEFDFILLPKYFIGSPNFSAFSILSNSISSMHINPIRFIRGSIFASLGTLIMIDSYNRMSSIEYND